MSSLSSNLTKIKNATDIIRTAVSMPDDDISDVATAVSSLGGKNSYKASSISEMRAISSASEGDICVVHSDPEFVGITSRMPFNVLYLPRVVENVNLDSYAELEVVPVNNSCLSSSGALTIAPDSNRVHLNIALNNFPTQSETFSLEIEYSYEGTTLSLDSVDYVINNSNIAFDLDNCILNLPISFSVNPASTYVVPDDLGKFFKTYKIVDWDPLTYSNNLVFVPDLPFSGFVYPTVNSVKFMPSPYLTPYVNSDADAPQIIQFSGGPATLFFSGSFIVQELSYGIQSSWNFDIKYEENCEGSDFVRLTEQGEVYPTINSYVQIKNNVSVDADKNILFRLPYELGLFGLSDSVTYNDLLPFAYILKTYADGSYTTYVYHDNKWNIVCRSV